MNVTAIFDIGKTNKKFFLFDENFEIVHSEFIQFDEIKDDDGDSCDDLYSIEEWVKKTMHKAVSSSEFIITKLNFSTYGASFVHIDENNKVLSPLYNYLKPYPPELLERFYSNYGSELSLAKATASSPLQMLNSGLQLYYLKHAKPELFKQIKWSMHLPQYLSFIMTGFPLSEYTSIGCHTMLWDFEKKDYHTWVYEEDIDTILPPIVNSNTCHQTRIADNEINVGVGIHDSSAALIPYIKSTNKPFALLSTGTWSITLNPFSEELLSEEELKNDCLNFLQPSGEPIKAARLFLGNEYSIQTDEILSFFQKEKGVEEEIKFDALLYSKAKKTPKHYFKWESLTSKLDSPSETSLDNFETIEEAYHQLIFELVQVQIEAIKLAIGQSKISILYVDGGFGQNEIFLQMLALHFHTVDIKTNQSSIGSALGAAMLIDQNMNSLNLLHQQFDMIELENEHF